MAHENLKFTLDLNKRNEWQPILGSQDYGTFYMVYILIKGYQTTQVSEENTEHKYICDFKLQNYRGDITIGFGDNYPEINEPDGTRPYDNEVDAYIDIKIQPFSLKHELNNKELIMFTPLESGKIIQTEFERLNPPIEIFNPNNPEKSLFLNPYKYIRDGEFYSEISTRKKGDSNPFPEPEDSGCKLGFCIPNRSTVL